MTNKPVPYDDSNRSVGEAEGQTGARYVGEPEGTDAIAYELGANHGVRHGVRPEDTPTRPPQLLDPLTAYEREGQRMATAGPRGRSMLNPNWEPPYTPYVKPPAIEPSQSGANLRQTVHVSGTWLRDGRDWIVDGSAVGVLPRPFRTGSVITRGREVPPVGREQVAGMLGPREVRSMAPSMHYYWAETLPEGEEPRKRPAWL